MEELSFIHLSDIHFHKNSGNGADYDTDLRKAILTDVSINAKQQLDNITGILVGGDIAYAGQKLEYGKAKDFLRELTKCIGIDEKSVACVPGNHDVDQIKIKGSRSILSAQKEIEDAEDMDKADQCIERCFLDKASPNLLFQALDDYNEFAATYRCNINADNPTWCKEYMMSHEIILRIYGLNSCMISSHLDHENRVEKTERKMIVNQNQIPAYQNNVIAVSLCHHPLECWKFSKQLKEKINKRLDIQLYGHQHEQTMYRDDDRLSITAGAAQPTRGMDWKPRYNWISFSSNLVEGDRILIVKVYPRVLSSDRDRFEADFDMCDSGKTYFQYELNFDQKRDRYLKDHDQIIEWEPRAIDVTSQKQNEVDGEIKSEIAYNIFELSSIQQIEILNGLGLYKEKYVGKKLTVILEDILENAQRMNLTMEFNNQIKEMKKSKRRI